MHSRIRIFRTLTLPAFLLVLLSAHAAAQSPQASVRYDAIRHPWHQVQAGPETYLVIDGFENISTASFILPHRREVLVFDGSVSPSFSLRVIEESAPIAAHPFFLTEYRYERDSTRSTALVSLFRDRGRQPSGAEVSDIRIVHRNGMTLVTLHIPVVRWDEAAQRSHMLEALDLRISGATPRIIGSRQPDALREALARLGDAAPTDASHLLPAAVPETHVTFHVNTDALFRLDKAWFAANGVPVAGLDPASVRLFTKGVEIPMGSVGMDDGSFDDGDFFCFSGTRHYGDPEYRRITTGDEPMPFFIDKYCDSSAFMLAWGGAPGMRLTMADAPPAPAVDSLLWFLDLARYELPSLMQFTGTNTTRQQIPDWTSEDTWHMGWISQESSWNAPLTLTNVHPGVAGHAWFKTSSWVVQNTAPVPGHNIAISVNASPLLDSAQFHRDQQALIHHDVAPEFLTEGANVLKVTSLRTGYTNQVNPLWAEIDYPRTLTATANALSIPVRDARMTGFRVMPVRGFTDTTAMVVRLRGATAAILPRQWVQQGATWTCLVTDTLAMGDRYVLSTPAAMPVPAKGTMVTVAGLRRPQNSAHYVLITTRAFATTAQQYVEFVSSHYGVNAMAVYVEDIYEEFSDGFFTPEAIKRFLEYAYTAWTAPRLTYVLLAGDANYNTRATGIPYPQNFVPAYGFPVGDGWLAQLNPLTADLTLRIGRLPVRTEQDLQLYLTRHKDYVSKPYTDWNKRYMFFSGGKPNVAGEIADLRETNSRIIRELIGPAPLAGVASQFYKTVGPNTDFGPLGVDQFRDIIAKGAMIITYLGHSGTQTWDNSIGDPAQLNNTVGRSPLVTDFGCSTGKFAEPDIECFAELFVRDRNSQAIGYVGNSSLGFTNLTYALPYMFLEAIVRDSIIEIGAAHQRAKQKLLDEYGESQINRICAQTNTLFCDPIIRLPIPPKPNLVLDPTWPRILTPVVTERNDSLRVLLPFANHGRATGDSLFIRIEDRNADSIISSSMLARLLPAWLDTLWIAVPIRGISGARTLRITLDPDNRIDEIYENDNTATVTYTVAAGSLQALNAHSDYASSWPDSVTILNPVFIATAPSLVSVEADVNPLFTQPSRIDAPYGTVFTRMKPPAPPAGPAAHWRALLDGDTRNPAGPFRAFVTGTRRGWVQADSLSFSRNQFTNATITPSGLRLANRKVNLRAISAGWYDGNFSVIEKDGINVLPNSFGWMYSLAVFDSVSLDLKRRRQFWTWGRRSDADSLAVEMTRISFGEIVVVATSDEPFKNIDLIIPGMHLLGSTYIDSIQTNDSWSMITRRSMPIGSAKELLTRKMTGKAIVDSTFTVNATRGLVQTEAIGPASRWNSLFVTRDTPPGSRILVTVYGRSATGAVDSLFEVQVTGDSLSLASVDATRHPWILLRADLRVGTNQASPILRQWSVDYVDLPELAMNYQSVKVLQDTVSQGSPVPVSIGIVNPGPAASGPFSVDVETVDRNNQRTLFRRLNAAGLAPDAWFTTQLDVPTAQTPGANQIVVTIDPEHAVLEQFRNNNVFIMPYQVKGDTTKPSFEVTFDGALPVYDDYVRPTPEIRIRLFDASSIPVTNPDNFIVYLDDTLITRAKHPDIIFQQGTGEEKATLIWSPALTSGEHIFRFNVRDGIGNLADSSMRILRVFVDGESKLVNFFNYPNPFAVFTDFTFTLTGSMPPDDMHIKIHTVAGRLVRDIAVPQSMLRIGFNAIRWDGLDEDRDPLGNGVYFVKTTYSVDGHTESFTGKISVLR